MAETQAGEPVNEVVPNDLIMQELETALHRATSENIVLRARIAARDRAAAQSAALPALMGAVPEPSPEAAL